MFIRYSVLIYSFLKKASLHHILVPTAHLHTHLPCPLMPIPIFHTHWTTYLSPSRHILSSFYTSITHFPHYFSYHPHHLSFIPHHFPKCMRPKTHGHPHLIIFLTVIPTVIHHTHLHAQVSNFHPPPNPPPSLPPFSLIPSSNYFSSPLPYSNFLSSPLIRMQPACTFGTPS